MRSCAIIWDYDGTLVDSRHRNLSVNRTIVELLTHRPWTAVPALASIRDYDAAVARCTNWRDFYAREFGLRVPDIQTAGRLWTEYQRSDQTPVRPFPGVLEALDALSHLPHGIVSQNASGIILATLEALGVRDRFGRVIGYEEVATGRQKPAPDGLLDCIAALTEMAPGLVFYIGDHPTDTECVMQARTEIETRGLDIEVRSVAALYGGESPAGWSVQPDLEARTPADIVDIVHRTAGCDATEVA
jgi:phosphoglycolate phosphatase-like HAD superfamily hydrolase